MRKSTAKGITAALTLLPITFHLGYALDALPPGPRSDDEHVIIDSTLDVGRGGVSYDFNATFAPLGNIYETGFRIRVTPNYSWYQYKIPDAPGVLGSGSSVGIEVLPGVGIAGPNFSFVGLFGPSFVESYDAGKNKSQTGVKLVASVYATPTERTMFYGSVHYGSLGDSFQLQLKTGAKVPAGFYIGPEFKISANNGITQTRYGAHLSSLKSWSRVF